MGTKRIVEVYCDNCGMTDYYPAGNVDKQARANEWIITADRKHFCTDKCRKEFRAKTSNAKP